MHRTTKTSGLFFEATASEALRSTAPTQPATLRRRAMLAFAIATPTCALAKAWGRVNPVAVALHRLLGRGASIREFGRMFLAREANAGARLLARLDGVPGAAVCSQIDTLRKEDFAAGHVVVIDGWVLARTEAEACAFVAAS